MKRTTFILLLFCSVAGKAQSVNSLLRAMLDTTFAAHSGTTGIIVSVITDNPDSNFSYAAGYSDKNTHTMLLAGQPVLTASNTKTYVAATILRLEEQGKLNITDSIGGYLKPQTAVKLRACGYNLSAITVRNLLSHTSGIDDYIDDAYWEFVNTERRHKWSRDEQIERGVKIGRPLGKPYDTFRYADLNYVLLTEIIEHFTGEPFYKSIRELLEYKKHDLKKTWFVSLEDKPKGIMPLAHQYSAKNKWDSYDLDPSWDLYGSGGIAATSYDLASFFYQLFEGKIIRDPNVLGEMHSDVTTRAGTNYCLGIRKLNMNGMTAYYHGGWWGTDAIYFPELHTAIAIFILERSEKDISSAICRRIAGIVKQNKK